MTSCLAMEAILQTFCSLEEEMQLHTISNQCFHNISASLFLRNLYPSQYCTPSCKFQQLNAIHKSVPYFHSLFKQFFTHFVAHKNVQEVCRMLWISEVACTVHVCLWNHFRDSTRNQWYSRLQDGFYKC